MCSIKVEKKKSYVVLKSSKNVEQKHTKVAIDLAFLFLLICVILFIFNLLTREEERERERK